MSKPEYKLHLDSETGEVNDIAVRINVIGNGWLVKAGGAPLFCRNADEVIAAMLYLVDEFLNATCEPARCDKPTRNRSLNMRDPRELPCTLAPGHDLQCVHVPHKSKPSR